jgi:PAS domain S-box-containing protein
MPVSKLKTPAFMSGKAFYENNVGLSEWAQFVPAEHLKVDNILMAPLLVEGEPAGMIGFANKPGGFTGRDALMASAFGEVASVALRDSHTLRLLQEGEERFRSVAETAHEAIICADHDAHIIFWNAGAEQAFGYSSDEMMGEPLTHILPERFREARFQSLLRESMDGEDVPSRIFDMTGIRKDGTEFPMELSRSTWRAAGDGGETNFAVIIRDITERKRAEEVLRQSEELYRTLLHTSPDLVTVTDLQGIVLDVSHANLDLYGFEDPQELIGRNGFDFIAPQDREFGTATMRRLIDECVVTNLELNLVRNDGSPYVGEVSAAVLRDPDGNPSGFVGVMRDITERKKAERDLQISNKELEGYAHVVSHDLKGPLSSMMTAGLALRGFLQGEWNDRTVRGTLELVDIIESNIKKSAVLIDELLRLANAGQKPLDVTDVDIAEVVEQVVGERAEEIKKKRISIKLDADLGRVLANRTHMYQLFSNLMVNAIKHNDNRKPEVSISYLGRTGADLHKYLVRDNGSGFDPANIDKIFLPFFSTVEGESGVGLATVDKIVNVYGGSIRAYNDDGVCFEFTIGEYSD